MQNDERLLHGDSGNQKEGISSRDYFKGKWRISGHLDLEDEESLLATLVLDQINGADTYRSRGSWD